MSGASGRRFLLMLCGLAAVTAGGCADLDFLPSWVPFQGPASDTLPGVVSPRERIEGLRKLSDTAGSVTPDERHAGRSNWRPDPHGERPADPPGNHPHAGQVSGPCGRRHPEGGAERPRRPGPRGGVRGMGTTRRRPSGGAAGRGVAERRRRRRAAGGGQGAGRNEESRGTAAAGRGPERLRPGHAVSGRPGPQEGHRQGPGQRRRALAAVRQGRAARAAPVAGRAHP